jgi:penicillin-binding protein 2
VIVGLPWVRIGRKVAGLLMKVFWSLLALGCGGIVFGQEPVDNLATDVLTDVGVIEEGEQDANAGAILTRKDARAITLKIPGPRGQIVDRKGESFAQNEVVYQVALQYEQFEVADREYVLEWAKGRVERVEKTVKGFVPKTDDELYDHYRHRRWLPLYVSGQLSAEEAKKLEPLMGNGLILQAVYRRKYPEGSLAAHIIGYTGSVGKLPTGPINYNEPLWEESEGRAGFEKFFDEQLKGVDGMKRLVYDEKGKKLIEEQVKRPRPGGTIVSTLNMEWQRHAESVLKRGCERGALVVIDVVTGEVLVMASRPTFDLNRFIPGIGQEDFTALQGDPTRPLFARAFQSGYPPASAFKPLVALAALNAGVVDEYKTVYSPVSIRIGNHDFKNWSSTAEGPIDVKRAIARSCNTWFYQVGIDTGPQVFLDLARRMGMGSKSGLPLIGETPGLVPDDAWMMKNENRRILNGDTANMSIGQGSLLASPLHVAQLMAAIGNGGALPKLSLISQVQDSRGRVVDAMVPEPRNLLGVDMEAVEIVREGMWDVVEKGYGTGRSARLSFTTLAGKTGTAQWGPPRLRQRLAWFAGFLPYDNPRYAFAVLYEGKPGEAVSGGRKAAPMVRNFFEQFKTEIKEVIEPPMKALVVGLEDDEDGGGEEEVLKAIPIDEPDFDEENFEGGGDEEDEDEGGEDVLRAVPVEEDDFGLGEDEGVE